MRYARLLARSLAIVATVSCGDSTAPRVPAGIVITPNQPVLGQGLSDTLHATVVDINGRAISGQTVTFFSADTAIAIVSPNGVVTSVGPVATVQVFAAVGAITNFVAVSVVQRIVTLTVIPESLVLNVTFSTQLQVTAEDFIGTPVSLQGRLHFASSDTTIVTVNGFGDVVSPGQTTGTATITVTADTFSVPVPVRVTHIPGSISASPKNMILSSGGTRQVGVTVRDVAGFPVPSPTVTYQSSAPGIFSVGAGGLVTSLGPNGNGTATATVDTLTAQVGVYIGTAPPGTLLETALVRGPGYGSAMTATGEIIVTLPLTPNAARGRLAAESFPDSAFGLNDPLGVSINPTGTTAYVALRGSNKIGAVDLGTNGVTLLSPVLGGGVVVGVAVSSDGQYVFAGAESQLYRLDAMTLAPIDSVPASDAFHLAIHPSQTLIYVSNNGSGVVDEVDWTTMTITRSFTGGAGVQAVAVAPDGSVLYVANEAGPAITTFDLGTGLAGTPIALAGAFGLAIASNTLYATVSSTGTVAAFNRTTGAALYSVTVGGAPRRPSILTSGGVLVVPNEGGWVDFIQ